MTIKEAIEWLIAIKDKYIHGGDEGFDEKRKQAIKTAISALEKQIPKKPIYKTEELFRFCPNCDFPLPLCFKFCNGCGQALDWGDDE